MTEQTVWDKLQSYQFDPELSSPDISPTVFRERGSAAAGACVSGLTSNSTRLSTIYQQICVGLIENMECLLPLRQLYTCGVREVLCTGSMFSMHPMLLPAVKRVYSGLDVRHAGETSAAYGAMLMALNLSTSSE